MDQSVYVRHSIESLARRAAGGGAVFAGDPAVPGPMADDADRRADHPDVGAGGDHRPVCHGQTINVMTLAGLSLAIGPMVDSAIICLENTHRHLGLGTRPGGGLPGRQRGGHAGVGRQLLHLAGARSAGPDAGPRRVPVPADGLGRRLRHDRRLHPVAARSCPPAPAG